jgi:hypothetical protein
MFFVLFYFLTYVHVQGRFVVEKNSITVLSPQKIRGKKDGAIGNFGLPNYGGYIVGSLVYPQKGSNGCDVFEGDKPFKFRSYRPTIVLLDRGGICFFSSCFFSQPLSSLTFFVYHVQIYDSLMFFFFNSVYFTVT